MNLMLVVGFFFSKNTLYIPYCLSLRLRRFSIEYAIDFIAWATVPVMNIVIYSDRMSIFKLLH